MQHRSKTQRSPIVTEARRSPWAQALLIAAGLLALGSIGACHEAEWHADVRSKHGPPGKVSVRGTPIQVKANETVKGDLVVIGGRATVDGEVQGNLVVVGGHLTVGPTARVRGDLVSVGNKTSRLDPAAEVKGTRVEVSQGIVTTAVENVLWAMDNPTAVVLTACLGLLVFLALAWLLMVRRYESVRFHATVEHRPVRAAILGLILFVGLHVLAIGAFFAQWGIGVSLVLWLVIGLLSVIGWLVVANHVGRAVARKAGWQMGSALAFLLGVAVALLAFLVPVLGQLAWTIGTWVGVGALLDPMTHAEIPPPAPAPGAAATATSTTPSATSETGTSGTAGSPPSRSTATLGHTGPIAG